MTNESTWHLGYIIGLPILSGLAMAALVCTAVSTWFWREDRRDNVYLSNWGPAALFAAGFSVLFIALAIGSAFPFDTSYHRYYKVAGEVQEIQHRLIKAGDGMAERYVFVIDGKPHAVDDTRATLTKKGDNVSLWCSKEYQYMGDSGWACEWGVAR